MQTVKPSYPWISVVVAIFVVAYFYLLPSGDLREFYKIPDVVFSGRVQSIVLVVFSAMILIELRYFQLRKNSQLQSILQMNSQLDELLQDRKALHAKAHVYAGQADKLKLFISDKLLEYIEYDEKFLHFKSIAGEVRHNGVISYDKIKTLLDQHIEAASGADDQLYYQWREARDSLIYLWDLLDLSTADNIALHIANQVCELEERFFQAELKSERQELDFTGSVFEPRQALQKALQRCFDIRSMPESEENGLLALGGDEQAWIDVHPVDPLLGNENHLVLVLENLINNAQFYAARVGDKKRRAAIALQLSQTNGYVCYRIYNRGPLIDEENASQIFQLGFSTRRVKEHHGKGLGLYFVNEVVKGYDGTVSFRNLINRPDMLSLRLEMATGEVITDVIELIVEGGVPLCRKSGADIADKRLDWQLAGELLSVEVTHQRDQKTYRLAASDVSAGEVNDPSQPAFPRWRLEIKTRRGQTLLQFKPLDITGVQFELRLPTLKTRMDGELLSADEAFMNDEVVAINNKFQKIESFS